MWLWIRSPNDSAAGKSQRRGPGGRGSRAGVPGMVDVTEPKTGEHFGVRESDTLGNGVCGSLP